MKIDKYIADLLYVYDCVTIPRFGGFVGNYSPARIQSLHTFCPPYKQLAFNINLKTNDGLLADYISRNENITFHEACVVISNFVDDINKGLKSNKKVEIEEVGFLLLNSEGNIKFEQNADANFLLDSFGLEAIQSPVIKRNDSRKTLDIKIKDRPPVLNDAPRIKIKKYWTVFAAVPLGLFLCFSFFNPSFKQKVSESYASVLSINSLPASSYTPRVAKTFIDIQDEEVDVVMTLPIREEKLEVVQPVNSETVSESNTVDEVTIPIVTKKNTFNVSSKRFHIIGGCFEIEQNAESFVIELKHKGFNSLVVDKKNGLSRVSFGEFSNKEEALQALKDIKANFNDRAWLLVK